ncbi:hypothetical protein K470DRAFT_191479, partial [Piedraia hortae CBS 480.64]
PNIWILTSSPIPRGRCDHKGSFSLLTSCPCHRFMQHPARAGSTFLCDGCGHHACFHRLRNREGDGIAEREKLPRKRKKVGEG